MKKNEMQNSSICALVPVFSFGRKGHTERKKKRCKGETSVFLCHEKIFSNKIALTFSRVRFISTLVVNILADQNQNHLALYSSERKALSLRWMGI